MAIEKEKIKQRRKRRKLSIRNKINGTADRPRLTVYKSQLNIYVQLIDDEKGHTLCSASSLDKDLGIKGKCTVESAKIIGNKIAEKAKNKNIEQVVFDRNGYLFHGIVKALAESAREGGLKF